MKKVLTIITYLISNTILFSQTGPAGVGSSSNNVLWLKADAGTSSTTNNTPISAWNDQSGNGINVTQTISVQQPSFATNVINGMPAISFDNNTSTVTPVNDKMIGPDSPILDNTSGYSFFTVSRPQNVDNEARVIFSKRTTVGVDQSFMLFFFTSRKFYVDIQSTNNRLNTVNTYTANSNYLISTFYRGVASPGTSTVSVYNEEALQNVIVPTTGVTNTFAIETSSIVPDNPSPLLIGTTDATDPRPFGGYISEIITYTVTLNDAQRIIVNNYLSSKYDIALSANDKYAGDTPTNGNYDRNVAGVGVESSGANPTFSASATLGMGIVTKSGLGTGDYVLAGHASPINLVNITDVTGISGTNPARWERVWYIDVTNAAAVIQADIEFDMVAGGMSGTIPTTPSNYKLLYRTGTSGSWLEVATASSISGTRIIFNSYNFNNNADDGYYTIGTRNYTVSPLPIELLSFDAIMNDKKIDITWATATESNNDYYTIEKSKDGITFETLTIVDAAGNSLSTLNYADVDYNPYEGISYYRLKQTDFNGTFTYSKIVAVNYSLSDNGMTIFPNPTDGELTINIKDLEGKEVLVVIRDMTGKECFSKVILSQENQQLIAKDSEQKLASGIYIITASSNNKLYSKKIIVK